MRGLLKGLPKSSSDYHGGLQVLLSAAKRIVSNAVHLIEESENK
jgi:hypothetical protein